MMDRNFMSTILMGMIVEGVVMEGQTVDHHNEGLEEILQGLNDMSNEQLEECFHQLVMKDSPLQSIPTKEQ